MSDGIKRKSPTEILNEKYKDCIPSEFEGKVWDKKLIEAMHEFANQQQKPNHDWRQELFNYCSKEHGFDLLESDMNEIKRIIISNPDYIEFLNWQINQQQKSCHHKPLSDAEMLRMANAFTYHPIAHEGYLKGLMKANELIFKLTNK